MHVSKQRVNSLSILWIIMNKIVIHIYYHKNLCGARVLGHPVEQQ